MDEQMKKLQDGIQAFGKMMGMDSDEKKANDAGAGIDIQDMISKFAGSISPDQISQLIGNISPEQIAKITEMIPKEQLAKLMSNISPEQISGVKNMLGDNVNLDQVLGFFNSNKNK